MSVIDKVAWMYIKDRKVLHVRSKGKDSFYNPGGKREAGESDQQALMREVKEELTVDLLPETIKYLETFKAQAHGKPEGVFVEIKCYSAEFVGELRPFSEIEELVWLTSADIEKASPVDRLIIGWLKEKNWID